MTWDKEAPSKSEMRNVASGWDAEPPPEKATLAGTTVRKAASGLTGGFSDELAGIAEAGGRAIGLKGVGGPMKDIGLAEGGMTTDWEVLKDAYKRGRDAERKALKKDDEDNPKLSAMANIAGAIASPINKVAKGMSLVKGGAVLGGLNAYGGSDSESIAGRAADTLTGATLGAGGGKVIGKVQNAAGKGIQKLAEKISPARQKANADQIRAAAEELGIQVTPGMLDDTGFVERLESVLAKSPSMMGQRVARAQRNVDEGLRTAGQETLEGAANTSPFQTGEKFKSGVTAKVAERLDPIKTVFEEVAESTKFMPVTEKSRNAIVRNIENLDTFKLTQGSGKPAQYRDMISRIENADQVKTTMSLLNDDIKAASGAEKQVLLGIKEKLGTLEKNTITRSAIKHAKEGGLGESEGRTLAKEIVGDLREARTKYRGLNEDLREVSESARVKANKGPGAFLDSVESVPSERIQDKFFNVENNRQLTNLQKKFPEQFELLKSGKLAEIRDAAVDKSLAGQGRFSAQRFLKQFDSLNPEAKEMLFGADVSKIKNIETVQRSLPRNFNPSGTASEQGWQDAIYRNVRDIPTYALYKGASSNLARDISSRLAKSPQLVKLSEKNPQGFQNLVHQMAEGSGLFKSGATALPRAADSEGAETLKGRDKWAIDGFTNIYEKDQSGMFDDPETVRKLFSDKKTKELLVRASSLKPGSKQMDAIVEKIKERQAEGEE